MRLTRRLDPTQVSVAFDIVRRLLAERPLSFQEILRSGIPLHPSGADGPAHRIAASSQKHALAADQIKSEQIDSRTKKRKSALPSLEAPTRQQKVTTKEFSDKVKYEIVPEGHPFISARFLKSRILASLARSREIVTKVQHDAHPSSSSAATSSAAQKNLQFKYQLVPVRPENALGARAKPDKPASELPPIDTISPEQALTLSPSVEHSKERLAQSQADKKASAKLRKKAEKKAREKEEIAFKMRFSHLNTRRRNNRERKLEKLEGIRAEWDELDAEVARRTEAAGRRRIAEPEATEGTAGREATEGTRQPDDLGDLQAA